MKAFAHRAGGQVLTVGVAIAVASVAGYLLLVVVGRTLGPADYSRFVSYWGVLFGIGGAMSTIEQEAARHTSRGDRQGPSILAIAACAAGIGIAAGLLTMVPPLARRLYGTGPEMAALVTLAAVGFAAQFATRGVLMGSGRVRRYSLLVVAEALLRLAVLGALALTVGIGLGGAAAAVAAGSYAWIWWLHSARRTVHVEPPVRERVWRGAFPRAFSLMAAAALTAALTTGYPALVAAISRHGAGSAAGAIFAALTISRVPLLLVSPVQALAVPTVVRWRSGGGSAGPAPDAHRLVAVGSAVALALGVAGAGVGYALGPWLIRLLYGAAYAVPGIAVAVLVFSAVMLAWAALLSASLVALAAYRRMTAMWSVGLVVSVIWLAISPLGVVATTVVGALLGPAGALAVAIPATLAAFGAKPAPVAAD